MKTCNRDVCLKWILDPLVLPQNTAFFRKYQVYDTRTYSILYWRNYIRNILLLSIGVCVITYGLFVVQYTTNAAIVWVASVSIPAKFYQLDTICSAEIEWTFVEEPFNNAIVIQFFDGSR